MGRTGEPRTSCKGKRDSLTRWSSVIALTYSARCTALLDRKRAFVCAVLEIVHCYILFELWHEEKARRCEQHMRGKPDITALL